jgi:hypothetical protein
LLTWKKDDYTQSALLWFDFLKSMETYAEAIQFNLNGLKLWIHIFWNEKGEINHVGYFVHPESRQIDKKDWNSSCSCDGATKNHVCCAQQNSIDKDKPTSEREPAQKGDRDNALHD